MITPSYDITLELKRISLSPSPDLDSQQREWVLDVLLDKYACRITRLSDEMLLQEAEDWGII